MYTLNLEHGVSYLPTRSTLSVLSIGFIARRLVCIAAWSPNREGNHPRQECFSRSAYYIDKI